MCRHVKTWFVLFVVLFVGHAEAGIVQGIIDIPTRPGVSQRLLVMAPAEPKATVILFAGSHGGLQITGEDSFNWGKGNFLIRSREMFRDQGLLVIVVDAPSNRQSAPYLSGFRQTPEHVMDIKAVIAWARGQAKIPVWLVGTSRGTQSAAFVATELVGADGPDGLVLTSTILTDNKGRPVPAMPLEKLRFPVLVVHHEQDACSHSGFQDVPLLMQKLSNSPRKQLMPFTGGENRGDACEAMAYHGLNGVEKEVVRQIGSWIHTR